MSELSGSVGLFGRITSVFMRKSVVTKFEGAETLGSSRPKTVKPVDQPIGNPFSLMVTFLTGLVYIPLAATPWETVNKATVLVVHMALTLLAVYWLPDAQRSYSHRTLRWATISHSLVAICHAVAAIVILTFKLGRDGDNILQCMGHLATCGVILGIGKLAQLVFLLEYHFIKTERYQKLRTVSRRKPRLVRLGYWVKARACTPQGIIGLIITVPTVFCTTMVFTTFDFTSDCVYTAKEPWKTATSICVSLLMGMVMLLYLQMAYSHFKRPGNTGRMLAYRFGAVGVLSVFPTLSADFYVLYVAPALTIEVCLNYCAWFMFVGLVAIRYLQNMSTALCLQTSSFVDVSCWRVLSTCPLHDELVGTCFVGADFRLLVLPQDRPQLDRLHNSTENTHLFLLRIQASPLRPVCTVNARLLKVGEQVWQINMEDITQYVASTELPLQEYRDTLHTMQEPIMILDTELSIVFCNAAMVEFAQLDDQPTGKKATSFFPNLSLLCSNKVCATGWQETMLRTAQLGRVRERRVHVSFRALSVGSKLLYIVSAQDLNKITKDLNDKLNDQVRNGLNKLQSVLSSKPDEGSSIYSEQQQLDAEEIIGSMSSSLSLLLGDGNLSSTGSQADAAFRNTIFNTGFHMLPKGANILIVDDSKINLALLSRHFTKSPPFSDLGWHVFTAQTGEEALNKIKTGPVTFWLVVLDQNMEDAGGKLTGSETTRAILSMEELSVKPIIFGATSHTGPHDVAEALDAGQHYVWGKPYPNPVTMYEDLRQVVIDLNREDMELKP
mmetsp:Transcript_120227/g.209300  ORF Transcript_120227/g.209300 Transcript_120227/m.209300 type:complete len:782 (-) Transcript_120227:103-2448(-)